jgi:hypothetical protein
MTAWCAGRRTAGSSPSTDPLARLIPRPRNASPCPLDSFVASAASHLLDLTGRAGAIVDQNDLTLPQATSRRLALDDNGLGGRRGRRRRSVGRSGSGRYRSGGSSTFVPGCSIGLPPLVIESGNGRSRFLQQGLILFARNEAGGRQPARLLPGRDHLTGHGAEHAVCAARIESQCSKRDLKALPTARCQVQAEFGCFGRPGFLCLAQVRRPGFRPCRASSSWRFFSAVAASSCCFFSAISTSSLRRVSSSTCFRRVGGRATPGPSAGLPSQAGLPA